jgi:hypothetical protein
MELITRNVSQRIDIVVRSSATDLPVNAQTLELTVLDQSEQILFRDAFPELTLTGTIAYTNGGTAVVGTNTRFSYELSPGDVVEVANVTLGTVASIQGDTALTLVAGTALATSTGQTATKATTRIVQSGVGRYYLDWGATGANANAAGQRETNEARVLAFHWRVAAPGEETASLLQMVKIVSVRTQLWLPYMRLIIDKSAKKIDDDPENPCYLGYTDAMLVQFLEDGLSWINAFQPYPMWSSIDTFPEEHRRVLFDAALVAGVTSQELFAVDTDLNYSDQGNVFIIDHQPKLAGIINATWQRLTQTVPLMKRHYVQSGAARIEAGPNFRFAQLLAAAPTGSTFRNYFTR